MTGLMNHCGATAITRDQLKKLADPRPMSLTHCPIRHDYFIDEIENALLPAGNKVIREEFGLMRRMGKDGITTHDNLFGIMELGNGTRHGDIARVVGLRNSGTMHFKAMLGAGNRVFVCDNLSFSAEVVVGRRHTAHIKRDLPQLMVKAMDELANQFIKNEHRVDIYKQTDISRSDVHDIMMLAMRGGAIPASMLKPWINTYHNPTHEEFRRTDCWALQNAFTEVAKKWSYGVMQERTGKLTGIIDNAIGLDQLIKDAA